MFRKVLAALALIGVHSVPAVAATLTPGEVICGAYSVATISATDFERVDVSPAPVPRLGGFALLLAGVLAVLGLRRGQPKMTYPHLSTA